MLKTLVQESLSPKHFHPWGGSAAGAGGQGGRGGARAADFKGPLFAQTRERETLAQKRLRLRRARVRGTIHIRPPMSHGYCSTLVTVDDIQRHDIIPPEYIDSFSCHLFFFFF